MPSLDNLPLRLKLLLAPSLCLLLLLLSAAGAMWGFAQQRQGLDSLHHDRLPSYTFIAGFEAGLREMNGQINRSLGYEAMGYNAKEVAVIDTALKGTETTLKAQMQERLKFLPEGDEKAQIQQVEKLFALYSKAVADTLDMKSSGPVIASTFLTTSQVEYDKLLAETRKISSQALGHAAHDVQAARESAKRASVAIALAACMALVLGVLLSLITARGLLKRVALLAQATDQLAAGDLSGHLQAHGRDEVGQLMINVGRVRERLATAIHDVQDASESIRVAASEIASGNADLSRRTEHQASSLQETAASMEEINATVKNNAATAQQADQLAASASQVAARGGELVAEVATTMEEITAASRRITEIIGTIDGIAFQTNILALNAAVEAARAGGQGRGFAVVATEVRVLAQRSATAAREIKVLIGASGEKVELGSKRVAAAGSTMQDIVGQVRHVSTLIREITSAAAEQGRGIEQVGQAVSELDQVTQQNAALVEQSAAAAESLNVQAERLAQAVAVFRLEPQRA